jgi:protein-S-isoprenylcysteine O-methyltransferase Ste14
LDPGQPTTALVTTGVYRFTRNPAYLGIALAYAAITVAMASVGAALLLLPTLYIIDCGVIQREERYLQDKFGDQYRQYQCAVRRWP